jgi:hypothetical protein
VEQPTGSYMFRTLAFVELLHLPQTSKIVAWMGAYGAPSPKPLWLLTNARWQMALHTARPRIALLDRVQLVDRREENGIKKVSGRKSHEQK